MLLLMSKVYEAPTSHSANSDNTVIQRYISNRPVQCTDFPIDNFSGRNGILW